MNIAEYPLEQSFRILKVRASDAISTLEESVTSLRNIVSDYCSVLKSSKLISEHYALERENELTSEIDKRLSVVCDKESFNETLKCSAKNLIRAYMAVRNIGDDYIHDLTWYCELKPVNKGLPCHISRALTQIEELFNSVGFDAFTMSVGVSSPNEEEILAEVSAMTIEDRLNLVRDLTTFCKQSSAISKKLNRLYADKINFEQKLKDSLETLGLPDYIGGFFLEKEKTMLSNYKSYRVEKVVTSVYPDNSTCILLYGLTPLIRATVPASSIPEVKLERNQIIVNEAEHEGICEWLFSNGVIKEAVIEIPNHENLFIAELSPVF